jgi:hypothetical protein
MRFILKFNLWLVLLASGGLGLLFIITPYAMLAQRIAFFSFGLRGAEGQGVLTLERYSVLRPTLWATALLALLLLIWQTTKVGNVSDRTATWWAREARRGLVALGRPWWELGRGAKSIAVVLLVVVAGLRLYYAFNCPLILDELASYDYCVLPGPAATASYYPFPNNHVFANLLAGLVHSLLPGASPALALRLLPTVAGLLTLPVVYLMLLRYGRVEVITLGLGLFWLSPKPIFYAIAGRGYAWTMLAGLAGLGAVMELLRPPSRRPSAHRLAWVVFGVSAVVGLYAVPPHLYTVLALGLGLLLGFGMQRGRQRTIRLTHLAAATLGVGIVVLVLYGPIGAVSGWPALLDNPYVAPDPWSTYRVMIGPYLMETATELLGWAGGSTLAWLVLVVVAPLVLLLARRLPKLTQQLGWLLYLQLTLWILFALGQHKAPPARTLLMVYFAFMLLGAVVVQAVVLYWPGRRYWRATWLWPALSLLFVLYAGIRLPRYWQRSFAPSVKRQVGLRAAYVWLRAQHPRRIWVDLANDVVIWHHYALVEGQKPLPLVIEEDAPTAQPGPVGELEVFTALPPLRPGQPLVYRNNYFFILPVSPTQPRVFKPEP